MAWQNKKPKVTAPTSASNKNNVTIDWTICDNVQAHLRVMVKKLLKRYKYPPEKREKTRQTV